MRNLILVFGDQLNADSAVFDGFDPAVDAVWMAENDGEISYVWSHKHRIVFFLSAMRHFRDELRARGYPVVYTELPAASNQDRGRTFADILRQDIQMFRPLRLRMVMPGDDRVRAMIVREASEMRLSLDIVPDRHFYDTTESFNDFARGKIHLVMEFFYRRMRKAHHVLMDVHGDPEGGQWNYDQDNRRSFGKTPPKIVFRLPDFPPDEITCRVIDLVNHRYAGHPGRTETFNLPVDRANARRMLKAFIDGGLKYFGTYQDAMHTQEAFVYHSRLSAPMNVKLISPRECVEAAEAAYRAGRIPLSCAEGFIRQILGWREYVRGIYWRHMPDYLEKNELGHHRKVPSFFWDGKTRMNCIKHVMENVLDNAYAHHIQRLMVLGLFAQLYGVSPKSFHDWHMAMYVDAVDWVSLPNALGMSQYGDGGIMSTKPYCATGQYIKRMSDYCRGCPYDPGQAAGEKACPFTVLYWDFWHRHYHRLKNNHRLSFMVKTYEAKAANKILMAEILQTAGTVKTKTERGADI